MAGGTERANELFEEVFGKAVIDKAEKKKAAAQAAKVKPNASKGASAGDNKRSR